MRHDDAVGALGVDPGRNSQRLAGGIDCLGHAKTHHGGTEGFALGFRGGRRWRFAHTVGGKELVLKDGRPLVVLRFAAKAVNVLLVKHQESA